MRFLSVHLVAGPTERYVAFADQYGLAGLLDSPAIARSMQEFPGAVLNGPPYGTRIGRSVNPTGRAACSPRVDPSVRSTTGAAVMSATVRRHVDAPAEAVQTDVGVCGAFHKWIRLRNEGRLPQACGGTPLHPGAGSPTGRRFQKERRKQRARRHRRPAPPAYRCPTTTKTPLPTQPTAA